MRTQRSLLIAFSFLTGTVRAEDGAAARAIVEQAIRAHGGEAAITRYPSMTAKTKGIFQGYDRTPVFFHTCETTTHGADQFRVTVQGELYKQKFQIINGLDGNSGWVRQAGETRQETTVCSPAQLADFQASGYVSHIATLVPLLGREFTLALAGDQKSNDQTLVGIRVSSKGRRDVTLYFDKQTHLLSKIEERGKAGTGVEGKVETVRGRYKEVQGVQLPISWDVYHNGRGLWSHLVIEYKLAETAAPGTFAKP